MSLLAKMTPELGTETCTDAGNGRRFAALHRERARYCYPHGRWYVWDGLRWVEDRTGAVDRLAKEVVVGIYGAATIEEDEARRKALGKWALASESETRLRAMASLARSEPGMAVLPDELDADPYLFTCLNGTVDLRSGQLRPHDPDDLITKLAPVEFDPDATCPGFDTFLAEILKDAEVRRWVQRFFGYCLTGSTTEQVLAFFYGLGANGKSTLIRLILAVMGEYAKQAEPDLLLSTYGSHPTGVADLAGIRLAVTTEIGDGRRLDEVRVKQLTGGDRIKARFMRQDFFEFEPTFKLLAATNHKPVVKGTEHAIWRRMRLVPFDTTIPPERQDPDLVEKLMDELPGILVWAVKGCIDWHLNGLGEPAAVTEATSDYRSEMDVFGEFLDECCVMEPDASEGAKELWEAFQSWCDDVGEKAGTRTAFGRRLGERGFDKGKHAVTRRTTYQGIRLRNGSETVRGPFRMNESSDARVA